MLEAVLPVVLEVLAAFEVEDPDELAEAIADAVVAAIDIPDESLRSALLRAVAIARAAGDLSARDEALIVAASQMARKIDTADKYFAELERDAIDRHLRPPSQDNVSLPTFLRYIDALHLTPAAPQPKPKGEAPGGKVLNFRSREAAARGGRSAG